MTTTKDYAACLFLNYSQPEYVDPCIYTVEIMIIRPAGLYREETTANYFVAEINTYSDNYTRPFSKECYQTILRHNFLMHRKSVLNVKT